MSNLEDLFEVDNGLGEDVADTEFIDINRINGEAEETSKALVKDLSKIYADSNFMEEHPDYVKRLDIELESLRVLIKMRKSDEKTHDMLVKAIGMNPGNASLYRSLANMQDTLMKIQTKMDETIKNLNGLMKNYQMEFNFKEEESDEFDSNEASSMKDTHRGSKAFIEYMNSDFDDTEEC